MRLAAIASSLAACLFATPAFAASVEIPGTSNIFKASATGGGDGTAPIVFSFAPDAGLVLTFSSVTGLTNCCGLNGTPVAGPDGAVLLGNGTTNVQSSGGISGGIAPAQMFLVGVFLDSSTPPAGTAPDRLNYSSGSLGFSEASYSPLLNQSFFIGDGLTGTGSGTTQQFLVPEGADTLVLGFLDSGFFQGAPSFYGDNPGSLSATFSIAPAAAPVPVPAGLMLLAPAVAGLAGIARRRG
jgi:hypothetical protein